MKAKTIARIQLILGIAFLILIIASSVFIVKKAFMDNVVWGANQMSDAQQAFKEANPSIDMTASGYTFHFVSHIVTMRTIAIMIGALFIMCLLIAVMLSMILILQGLKLAKK